MSSGRLNGESMTSVEFRVTSTRCGFPCGVDKNDVPISLGIKGWRVDCCLLNDEQNLSENTECPLRDFVGDSKMQLIRSKIDETNL